MMHGSVCLTFMLPYEIGVCYSIPTDEITRSTTLILLDDLLVCT